MAPAVLPETFVYGRHHELIARHLELVEQGKIKRLMICLPPGSTKDLCVNTRVLMKNGEWKRLGDIRIGEEVITHKGRPKKVLGVHDQGIRSRLEITTDRGRTVIANDEHPFLTPEGWVQAKDLKEEQALAVQARGVVGNSIKDMDEFWLAGYFVGDGGTTTSPRFTQERNEYLKHFTDICVSRGWNPREETRGNCVHVYVKDGAMQWIRDNGFFGKNSRTKFVPDWVLNGTDEQVAAFIAAYYQCDGCSHYREYGNRKTFKAFISSVNRRLLEETQLLLSRLGVNSRIRDRLASYTYKGVKKTINSYELIISDWDNVVKFFDTVPVFGYKRAIFDKCPIKLRGSFNADYLVDKVKSIRKLENGLTRCLTIEEDHTFTAEGIVVHNSVMTSVLFAAWIRGKHPSWPIIGGSHSIDLAQKFARDVRDLTDNDIYKMVFPGVSLREDVQAAGRWYTNQGGIYLAAGAGKRIAGMRGRLIILDDVVSEQTAYSDLEMDNLRRWYTGGLRTRLLPGGAVILINTRWSLKDLSAFLMEEERRNPGADKWEKIEIPAILDEPSAKLLGYEVGDSFWPEYWPLKELESIRANTPPYQWESLYMQRPIMEEGNLFKNDYFQWWDKRNKRNELIPPECEYIIQTADLATTTQTYSDYSVIQTWGLFPQKAEDSTGKEYTTYHMILLDQWRDKVEYPELRRKAQDLYRKYNPNRVIVEAKMNGHTLIQDLRRAGVPVMEQNPEGDKRARANAAIPLMFSKRLWLPLGKKFATELLNEALSFNPQRRDGGGSHKHDDQVDAMTMAINFSQRHYRTHAEGDRWEIPEDTKKVKARSYWS